MSYIFYATLIFVIMLFLSDIAIIVNCKILTKKELIIHIIMTIVEYLLIIFLLNKM